VFAFRVCCVISNPTTCFDAYFLSDCWSVDMNLCYAFALLPFDLIFLLNRERLLSSFLCLSFRFCFPLDTSHLQSFFFFLAMYYIVFGIHLLLLCLFFFSADSVIEVHEGGLNWESCFCPVLSLAHHCWFVIHFLASLCCWSFFSETKRCVWERESCRPFLVVILLLVVCPSLSTPSKREKLTENLIKSCCLLFVLFLVVHLTGGCNETETLTLQ